jgi:hypothetical protein
VPLADTAEELKSIALAMQADQSKVLNLGIAANEHGEENRPSRNIASSCSPPTAWCRASSTACINRRWR